MITHQRKGRGEALEAHTLRTDRFRGEEDFETLDQALSRALERSLKSVRRIYVVQTETGFTVNSHGVEMIGHKTLRVFKKGVEL